MKNDILGRLITVSSLRLCLEIPTLQVLKIIIHQDRKHRNECCNYTCLHLLCDHWPSLIFFFSTRNNCGFSFNRSWSLHSVTVTRPDTARGYNISSSAGFKLFRIIFITSKYIDLKCNKSNIILNLSHQFKIESDCCNHRERCMT